MIVQPLANRLTGGAGMSAQFTPKQISLFWSRVDSSGGPDACWPWIGPRYRSGYGHWRAGHKNYLPHRVAFFLEYGHWPTPCGMHQCDFRPCCNPAHIVEGTHRQNSQDMVAKGRWNGDCGESHYASKVTAEDVRAIRQRCASGETIRSVAAAYGINGSTVSLIKLRQTWKRVA